MPTDFLSLLAVINAAQVPYVVVGGLAMLLHGIDRVTADIDLVIDLAPESARAVVMALFADETIRGQWQQLHGMQVFSLWDTENRRPTVDILLAPPVSFT